VMEVTRTGELSSQIIQRPASPLSIRFCNGYTTESLPDAPASIIHQAGFCESSVRVRSHPVHERFDELPGVCIR
jgi:hypothetical protein